MPALFSRKIGDAKEQTAIAFLRKSGLKLVARNYQCRHGEIDIVMRDQTCLVFVEVRYRTSKQYGGAAASITSSKRKKLWKTAQSYLQCHRSEKELGQRFDVIAIDGDEINWIKNAFEVY